MSVVYHSYNSGNAAVNELVAGAYAEHVGTLGFDEDFSSISRNAVENRVITTRILEDEAKYLLKTEASSTYSTKAYVQSLFPVGTIYMNDQSSTVPFDFGTWQLIDGKFLYGCNSSFSDLRGTGGATSVTLTTAHFPTSNIGITFPAVSGTTDSTDTNHTHGFTTNTTTNNSCRFRFRETTLSDDDSAMGWIAQAVSGSCRTVSGGTPLVSTGGVAAASSGDCTIEIDFNHNHSGNTGWMSANWSHNHSFSIPAQSLSFKINNGTQNSFSIVPPYYKVAIWHRVS